MATCRYLIEAGRVISRGILVEGSLLHLFNHTVSLKPTIRGGELGGDSCQMSVVKAWSIMRR